MLYLNRLTSSSTKVLVNEAVKMGIGVEIISYKFNLLRLSLNGQTKLVKSTCLPSNCSSSVCIANSKYLTKKILEKENIPVIKYFYAKSYQKTQNLIINNNFFPCVIKPVDGAHGNEVYINIENKEELSYVLKNYYKTSKIREVLIEEYIKGNDYRVFVVNNKVVAAMQRIPAHVVGNGKQNIKELVKKHNKNPMIGKGFEKPFLKIVIDKEVARILSKQKLTTSYIPKINETIFLRENANISTGGTGNDVTDSVSQEIKELAIKAAIASGLKIVGVDIMQDLMTKACYIIELNDSAGFDIHHFPAIGKKRNVAREIINSLFEKEELDLIQTVNYPAKNVSSEIPESLVI